MIRTCPDCGEVIPAKQPTCPRCLPTVGGRTSSQDATGSTPSSDEVDTVGDEVAATARSSRDELPSPAELVGGRYRLLSPLGAGGGGMVYRALDRELDREVALKLLTGANEKSIARFRREVGLAQELSHPGVVRVYDLGRDGDRYYLSMQLVEGKSLSARLRDDGPLPISEARALFLQLCDAVQYLHSAGIVHRDIKPANVLLDAATGHALLADFGLAREAVDPDSEHTEIAGTPGYMAPEAMLGEPPSVATDIYGLGATFYAALTGKRAVDGASWGKILAKGREGLTTIRTARADVPADLAFVVDTCLQADPRARFASVTEVIEALEARTGSRWQRAWLRARRRRGRRLLAAVGAALLVAGGGGIWAVRAARRAVEVKLDGHTVQGLNRFGGVVWQRTYGGDKVTLETWPAACGQPARSHVIETTDATTATWRRHTHLMTLNGEELFDSTPLDGKDLGFRDPRRESSGTLVFDVLRWSRCQAPDPSSMPVLAWNEPWYASVLGIHRPGGESRVTFSFSGRVLSIAASAASPASYAIVAGNHELLHTSAFAIVRADNVDGANPPRMVDQAFERSGLWSYTLLPLEIRTYGQDAVIAEPDGSWRVCTPDDRCEVLDRFGNLESELRAHPGVDPEALLRDRMDRFRRLSEIDLSRRRGAHDVAEEGYRELAAKASGSAVEQAAVHLIGARIAVARGDLDAVVARTTQSEKLWSVTQDAALLRASARVAAGQHVEALRDLEAAEGRRAAARYNTTKTRFVSAWLTGDHDLAVRLLDSIDFPVVQVRLRALTQIEDGEPARALAALDSWTAYYARERVQLTRALALVDLGRPDEAGRALELELERHPWLRAEADGVALAIDLAAGRAVPAERVAAILVDFERRGRQELDARLLLTRIRIDAADALTRAGQPALARRAVAGIAADHPGTALRARGVRLTAALSSSSTASSVTGRASQ